MVLCFTIWLKLRARPSPLWDSGCLGEGGVFNFALAQIVFYQRIHISNMILHINQAVCKWPNRKIAKSGERKMELERKMKTGFHSEIKKKNDTEFNGGWKNIFHCNILKQESLNVAHLLKESGCFHLELPHSRCESFLPSGYTIILKTFTIVPLIKPHREGLGLINTSYSGDYCLFRPNIDSKHPGSIVM